MQELIIAGAVALYLIVGVIVVAVSLIAMGAEEAGNCVSTSMILIAVWPYILFIACLYCLITVEIPVWNPVKFAVRLLKKQSPPSV